MNLDKLTIAFIGFPTPNGMALQLSEDLAKRGHNIYFSDALKYAMNYCTRRLKNKKPDYVPLQEFLMGKPLTLNELDAEFPGVEFDVIFIEQANLVFLNDYRNEDTLVIYYHRDLPGTFNCYLPDLLLFRFEESKLFLKVYHRYAWYKTRHKTRFLNGVYPPLYKSNAKKRFKDLVWIGPYKPLEEYIDQDVIQHDYYINNKLIKDWARDEGLITVFENAPKIPFEMYKYLIERSEGILVNPGLNSYITRKCYEAGVCRTVMVLWVQSERAKKAYDKWGLIDCFNCFMFESKEHLVRISELIRSEEPCDVEIRESIKDNAYKWVMDNHTYHLRATYLLRLIRQIHDLDLEKLRMGCLQIR